MGVPVVTGRQVPEVLAVLAATADALGAPLAARDRDWRIEPAGDGLAFTEGADRLALPRPGLLGTHQFDNAGIAIAALRRAGLVVPAAAWNAIADVEWPARLERLHGALAHTLPAGFELWLDGGHNPAAGAALAAVLDGWRDRPLYVVVGMKETKDVRGFLAPLLPLADGVWAVREARQEFAVGIDVIVPPRTDMRAQAPRCAGRWTRSRRSPRAASWSAAASISRARSSRWSALRARAEAEVGARAEVGPGAGAGAEAGAHRVGERRVRFAPDRRHEAAIVERQRPGPEISHLA